MKKGNFLEIRLDTFLKYAKEEDDYTPEQIQRCKDHAQNMDIEGEHHTYKGWVDVFLEVLEESESYFAQCSDEWNN